MTVLVHTETGQAEVFKTIYACDACGRVAEIDACPTHGVTASRHIAEPAASVTADGELVVERRTFTLWTYPAGCWVDWAVA
jgi:hypothetical protein